VTLNGGISGDYVIVESRDDGSLVLQPDTSMEAIRQPRSQGECREHSKDHP
jgi:hypothetical protein